MRSSLDIAAVYMLHWIARIALQLRSPVDAKRIIDAIGRRLPPHRTLGEAQLAARRLRGQGACLSRAMTVAARMRGAEVVIGVDPRVSVKLEAHAWVEVNGAILDDAMSSSAVQEIARLRDVFARQPYGTAARR